MGVGVLVAISLAAWVMYWSMSRPSAEASPVMMPPWRPGTRSGVDLVVARVGEGDADVEDQSDLDDVGGRPGPPSVISAPWVTMLASWLPTAVASPVSISAGAAVPVEVGPWSTIVLPPELASPTTVAVMTTAWS